MTGISGSPAGNTSRKGGKVDGSKKSYKPLFEVSMAAGIRWPRIQY